VFVDAGRADIESPTAGELSSQDMLSIGTGLLVELSDNFSGGVYYGLPLKGTTTTNDGHGRFHVNLIWRW